MPANAAPTKTASPILFYLKSLAFGFLLFGAFYGYTTWLEIPNVLNKAVADTAIMLMGFSMLLSSLTYFWDVFDGLLKYRKYLGLVGFYFFIAHFILSFGAFQSMLSSPTIKWNFLTGTVAAAIFTVMALISNTLAMKALGAKLWRYFLRTGYLAVIFTWLHVVLLKSKYWVEWVETGFNRPPSTSLIVAVFMFIVIDMRLALFLALKLKSGVDKHSTHPKTSAPHPNSNPTTPRSAHNASLTSN